MGPRPSPLARCALALSGLAWLLPAAGWAFGRLETRLSWSLHSLGSGHRVLRGTLLLFLGCLLAAAVLALLVRSGSRRDRESADFRASTVVLVLVLVQTVGCLCCLWPVLFPSLVPVI